MLMLETLTTRVLTITTGSQMALVTVSLAMFGLSAGALYVLLHPVGPRKGRLARASRAYAVSVLLTFLGQLHLPHAFEPSLWGTVSSLALIVLTTIPYCLGGVCVSTILSQAADRVGKLDAIDLLGAALGAWLMVALLGRIGGETAMLCAAWLGALGALALSRAERQRPWPGLGGVAGRRAAGSGAGQRTLSLAQHSRARRETLRTGALELVLASDGTAPLGAPPVGGFPSVFPAPIPSTSGWKSTEPRALR